MMSNDELGRVFRIVNFMTPRAGVVVLRACPCKTYSKNAYKSPLISIYHTYYYTLNSTSKVK